jgi:hypothetical protein
VPAASPQRDGLSTPCHGIGRLRLLSLHAQRSKQIYSAATVAERPVAPRWCAACVTFAKVIGFEIFGRFINRIISNTVYPAPILVGCFRPALFCFLPTRFP